MPAVRVVCHHPLTSINFYQPRPTNFLSNGKPFFLSRDYTDMPQYVYFFGGKSADGNGKLKELLGGKGANLAEMCLIGLPVPAGFTITTEVCAAYYDHNKKIPEAAIPEIDESVKKVEAE